MLASNRCSTWSIFPVYTSTRNQPTGLALHWRIFTTGLDLLTRPIPFSLPRTGRGLPCNDQQRGPKISRAFHAGRPARAIESRPAHGPGARLDPADAALCRFRRHDLGRSGLFWVWRLEGLRLCGSDVGGCLVVPRPRPAEGTVAALRLGVDCRGPHVRDRHCRNPRLDAMAEPVRGQVDDRRDAGHRPIRTDLAGVRLSVAVPSRREVGWNRRVLLGLVRLAEGNAGLALVLADRVRAGWRLLRPILDRALPPALRAAVRLDPGAIRRSKNQPQP